jgi:hypothetical protein
VKYNEYINDAKANTEAKNQQRSAPIPFTLKHTTFNSKINPEDLND